MLLGASDTAEAAWLSTTSWVAASGSSPEISPAEVISASSSSSSTSCSTTSQTASAASSPQATEIHSRADDSRAPIDCGAIAARLMPTDGSPCRAPSR